MGTCRYRTRARCSDALAGDLRDPFAIAGTGAPPAVVASVGARRPATAADGRRRIRRTRPRVGCGALGWLRILSDWVGPSGQVVGTDMDVAKLDQLVFHAWVAQTPRAVPSFVTGEGSFLVDVAPAGANT